MIINYLLLITQNQKTQVFFVNFDKDIKKAPRKTPFTRIPILPPDSDKKDEHIEQQQNQFRCQTKPAMFHS